MIELLVTIAIIAMLMGLLITGVRKAMTTAKQTGIVFEIARLATSLEGVKAKSSVYPPCMGAVNNVQAYMDTPTRFNKYMRAAYPRCLVKYADLATGMGNTPYQYTYANSAGAVNNLNVLTMDQAEALVFWLGGFPTPRVNGLPASSRKLIGFYTDPTNPFKLDLTGNNITARSPPLYDFDDDRLVDNDNDGWYEYAPAVDAPPYVYFDSALYTSKTTATAASPYNMYPPVGSPMVSMWGYIGPYAGANLVGGSAMQWLNPNTFQILSSGLDNQYGPIDGNVGRITVPSTGAVYLGGQPGNANTLSTEESDNLANFTDGTIFDASGK
jgi:Tfp pilus assembly major pilin PilA